MSAVTMTVQFCKSEKHEYPLGPGTCVCCIGTKTVQFHWWGSGYSAGTGQMHLSACPWHPDNNSNHSAEDYIDHDPCEICGLYECECEE